MYKHRDLNQQSIELPAGKVVCVGRNYADHIEELNNAVPDEPLLFFKPATSLCEFEQPIAIPTDKGACHNELEVAVLIQSPLTKATEEQAVVAIWGYALGLDLTLRDVQSDLKSKGLPWERAKGFDNSCPLSYFVPQSEIENRQQLGFSLTINGQIRQQGNTRFMLYPIVDLLVEISRSFTLMPGDVVMTGTPKGVGPLFPGDRIEAGLEDLIKIHTHVV